MHSKTHHTASHFAENNILHFHVSLGCFDTEKCNTNALSIALKNRKLNHKRNQPRKPQGPHEETLVTDHVTRRPRKERNTCQNRSPRRIHFQVCRSTNNNKQYGDIIDCTKHVASASAHGISAAQERVPPGALKITRISGPIVGRKNDTRPGTVK